MHLLSMVSETDRATALPGGWPGRVKNKTALPALEWAREPPQEPARVCGAPSCGAFGSAALTRRKSVVRFPRSPTTCRRRLRSGFSKPPVRTPCGAMQALKNPALAERTGFRNDSVCPNRCFRCGCGSMPRPSLHLSRRALPSQTSRTPLLHRSRPPSCKTAPRMRAVATQEIRPCLATGFSCGARRSWRASQEKPAAAGCEVTSDRGSVLGQQ